MANSYCSLDLLGMTFRFQLVQAGTKKLSPCVSSWNDQLKQNKTKQNKTKQTNKQTNKTKTKQTNKKQTKQNKQNKTTKTPVISTAKAK